MFVVDGWLQHLDQKKPPIHHRGPGWLGIERGQIALLMARHFRNRPVFYASVF